MNRMGLGVFAVLAACLGVSSMAYATAALANGAATSAKPTAKDAAKKQIQIAADPVGITDFQFTLQYDPSILHVAFDPDNEVLTPLIEAINGYTLGLRNNPYSPGYLIDQEDGLVTVQGYWDAANGPVPDYELNVYSVVFELNEGVPLTQQFTINSIGVTHNGNDGDGGEGTVGLEGFNGFSALESSGPTIVNGSSAPYFGDDFMIAGQLVNGQLVTTRTYTVDEILPSTTGLISIDSVPTPAASMAAVPGLGLLLLRRRTAAV